MRTIRSRILLTAAVLGAAAVGGVAAFRLLADSEPRTSDPGPVHVHALGINPGDRALFIATHTGLYRLAREAERPERVSDRHQDTMGFTVVGPDHFLGSGHPDLRDDLPPLLGLIESRDAGQNWSSISLLGDADFHALRVHGPRIAGYNASNSRIMISDDRGRSWHSLLPPQPLVDLVIAPDKRQRLLAAGESSLFLSVDSGVTWEHREDGTGLLAWPLRDQLYLLDGTGQLWISRDGGLRWQARGRIGGAPAAFVAADSQNLFAATHDGEIRQSRNGGRSWTTRARP